MENLERQENPGGYRDLVGFVTSVVITELSSLSVLQNERKTEIDLESVGLTAKDFFKGLRNRFNKRCTIVM